MADNAVDQAVDLYGPFLSNIKDLVNASADLKTARSVLEKFVGETFLESLSNHLQDSIETGEALGRSAIVEKDRILSKTEVTAVFLAVTDGKPVRVAFDLIPKEARDFIRYKAMTIAGVEHTELLQAVKNALDKAIEEGKSFNDFKAELNQIFDSYGVTRLSHRHIDTVYRTNVFTAYSVGAQAQVFTMAHRFPLWRYSAIKDNRTRPDHLELNGMIFRVGEGPLPPIDYNCRCTAIYLHISEIERLGLSVPEGYAVTPEGRLVQWSGDPGYVRFNSRSSFEEWKSGKKIPAGVQNWVNDRL